jgi:hypothetical protein
MRLETLSLQALQKHKIEELGPEHSFFIESPTVKGTMFPGLSKSLNWVENGAKVLVSC